MIIFSFPFIIQADEEIPINQWTNEILIERGTIAFNTLETINTHLLDLEEALERLEEEIALKVIERKTLEIPEIPEIHEIWQKSTLAEQVLKILDARMLALEKHENLVAEEQALIKMHREVALNLASEEKLFAKTREKYNSVLLELENRLESNSLNASQWQYDSQQYLLDHSMGKELWKTIVAEWQAEAERDELLVEERAQLSEKLARQQKESTDLYRKVTVQLQEAVLREEWLREFNNLGTKDLIALFNTRVAEWHNNFSLLNESVKLFESKQAELIAEQKTLDNLPIPVAEQFKIDDSTIIPTLRQAQEDLLLTAAQHKFNKKQKIYFENSKLLLKALQEDIKIIIAKTKKVLHDGIELTVIAHIVKARTVKENSLLEQAIDSMLTKSEKITPQIQRLREKSMAFETLSTEFDNQLKSMNERLLRQEQNAQKLLDTLQKQEKLAKQEAEWAKFLEAAQAIDSESLIQQFQETVSTFNELQEFIENQKAKLAVSRSKVESTVKTLKNFRDPVILDNIARQEEFYTWLIQNGFIFKTDIMNRETEKSVETKTNKTEESPEVQSVDENEQTVKKLSETELEIERVRKLRNHNVIRNINIFQELFTLGNALENVLNIHITNLKTSQETHEKAFSVARRAWVAATTLQTRQTADTPETIKLPDNFMEWTSRRRLTKIQNSIQNLQQEFDNIEKYKKLLNNAAAYMPLTEPLNEWGDNLKRQLFKLQQRLQFENDYDLPDPKDLDEFEQKRYQHFIDERIERDQNLYEKVLETMFHQYCTEIDQLLYGFYEKLWLVEYKQDNLESRQWINSSLIKLNEGNRLIFKQLETGILAWLEKLKTQLDVEGTKIKAVLYPSQTKDLLSQLAERTGVVVRPEQLPKLPTTAIDNSATQVMKEKLMKNLFELWLRVAVYTEKAQEFHNQYAEFGGIDNTIAHFKEKNANLQAMQQELHEKWADLLGHTTAELNELLPEDRPRTNKELKQFFKGEIGLLREAKIEALLWGGAITLFWLAIIPLLAYVSVRIVNTWGHRLIAEVTQLSTKITTGNEDDFDQQEQEERTKVLFRVFSNGWVVIVTVLTIIYMLKAIGVDVLPLLASAGVLGLAFAFGAQQLVRDFVTGFFILLENQFRKGEEITVNDDITGVVEKVSPRLTILRDNEGGLHHIPNGSINHVNNRKRNWSATLVQIPVDYQESTKQVIDCLKNICDNFQQDIDYKDIISNIEIEGISNFTDYAVIYDVHIETPPGEQDPIANEFRSRVKLTFEKMGIKMI